MRESWGRNKSLSLAILIVLAMVVQTTQGAPRINKNGLKSETFLSPRFDLEPGSVCNKYFYGLDFPKGHIAVKAFDAEIVDEAGDSVPLHEAYMHHWLIGRYFFSGNRKNNEKESAVFVPNSGVCLQLPQYFGLGAETRRTVTDVPDPFGIEVGTPPRGFEEGWMVNIHVIDTRGVVDKKGCAECRCDLFNVTVDEAGVPIEDGYKGGLRCCMDAARCRVRQGYEGAIRGLYLKYTVTYVDWNPSIVPVKVYLFDVTDTFVTYQGRHNCMLEFQVAPCSADKANDECIYSKNISVSVPSGGYLIYAVAHQHIGGVGSTLHGEDGRVLCTSLPTYGNGTEPGNEDGYLVGMSVCYPRPGSIKIATMEKLTVISNYSNAQMHTGVMGLYYILVAETLLPKSTPLLHESFDVLGF